MVQQSFPFASPASTQNPEGVVNSDEKYRRMARWWREDGVVDGYFEELNVGVGGDPAFTCVVRPGAAFVNGVFYENTTPLTLQIPTIGAGQSRVDRVVLRLDVATKQVTAAVKTGTVGSVAPPPLRRDATVWETTLDEFLVNSTGGKAALGNRYDRWSYGDRRSGRPFGWLLGLASGTLLPRNQLTRLGLVADNDSGFFAEGVKVTLGASASGITVQRDGVYDVSIQGRIELSGSVAEDGSTVNPTFFGPADRSVPETVVAEHQRIIAGAWTRISRVGGPDWSLSASGFFNCLEGDAIVPYAYQNHPTGTWRLTDRLSECRFSGVWRRDYGGA